MAGQAWAPKRKVLAGTLGATVMTLVFWSFDVQVPQDVPEEVALALTSAANFILGYLVPSAPAEQDAG